MKNLLTSELIDIASLTETLKVGISAYSLKGACNGSWETVSLLLVNGSVLRIRSKVTEVSTWHEVGTLVFDCPTASEVDVPEMESLPLAWSGIDTFQKLLLEEEAFMAESGLVIINQSGEQLTILPGAFPHSVAISAPFYTGDFEPEYDVVDYRRVPFL